jgi:hypothetical protein
MRTHGSLGAGIMSAMTVIGGNAAARRMRPRPWVAIVIAAGLLFCLPWVVVVAGGLTGGHPGGDPGGERQAALRQTSAAIPDGASVQLYADGTPHWDSCDGRAGTWGWGDITVDNHFTSGLATDAVIAHATATMAALRWTAQPLMKTPQGAVIHWTKTTAGNASANAQLSLDQNTPGAHTWDLSAGAPPEGQRASGC